MMTNKTRRLIDLVSVGEATVDALKTLGISSVEELAKCDASELYLRLSKLRGERQDPCVQDVFSAAIVQAKNPRLSSEKCKWWYWSSVRKKKQK